LKGVVLGCQVARRHDHLNRQHLVFRGLGGLNQIRAEKCIAFLTNPSATNPASVTTPPVAIKPYAIAICLS